MSDDTCLIETCLVCKVAWDVDSDPGQCLDPEHPHAINHLSEWNAVGHGRGA